MYNTADRIIVRVAGRLWPGTVTPPPPPTWTPATPEDWRTWSAVPAYAAEPPPAGGPYVRVTADCGDTRWHPTDEVWSYAQAIASLENALSLAQDPHAAHLLLADLVAIRNDTRS